MAEAPHVLIPSARRLITSLRDMGYDFVQAVADIVDNSIEAKATAVRINLEFDGDDSWVSIADNGHGMNPDTLREALRYGADREYDADALGKFGLGMKTASMSQCQRLTVASRWNPSRVDVTAYAWDLEHITKTNRWEILPLDRTTLRHSIHAALRDHPGTVVFWERLDRILGYKHPYGDSARRRMSQMCRDLEQHLGMVFHRFLTGEGPARQLSILVNGNAVVPWDPFCRQEVHTQQLPMVPIEVEYEGSIGQVTLRPYVLPNQSEFSNPEAFRLASGPNNWNQQQGFYVYRSHRMIQSGGWSNLRAPDEHTKLARVAVDFTPDLDEAFKINVAKMRAQLPASIRDEIRTHVVTVARLARNVYDKRAASGPSAPHSGISGGTGRDARHPRPELHPSIDQAPQEERTLTFREWLDFLRTHATEAERRVVDNLVLRIASTGEGHAR